MRSEKIPYQSHELFIGHAANQVAGMLEVYYPDIGLLRGHFANRWLSARCREGPGMFHDQSRTRDPLQQFGRIIPVRVVPELHAVSCQVEIEQRVTVDHRNILV